MPVSHPWEVFQASPSFRNQIWISDEENAVHSRNAFLSEREAVMSQFRLLDRQIPELQPTGLDTGFPPKVEPLPWLRAAVWIVCRWDVDGLCQHAGEPAD